MHQGQDLAEQSQEAVLEWLGSKECATFLRSCTSAVHRRCLKLGLALAEDENQPAAIWEYLNHKPGLAKQIIELLQQQDTTKARIYLANSYLQHLLDQRRQKKDSQFHYLYRKARDILSSDQNFTLQTGKKGSFFCPGARSQDTQLCTKPLLREGEGYQSWPDPAQGKGNDSDKAYILRAAAHFYDLACKSLGYKALLPVRELTAYLLSRTRFQRQEYRVREIPQTQEEDQDQAPRPWEDLPHPEEHQAQKSLVRSGLKDLATGIVNNWSRLQARIFYLSYQEELSQSRIAELTGYQGASGVKYQLQQAEQEIRRKTAAWPFLSPPDLDEGLFSELLEELFKICKQQTQDRNPKED